MKRRFLATVLLAAHLHETLEAFLVPRGRGEGKGATKVHADVAVDMTVSKLRSDLEKAVGWAHCVMPAPTVVPNTVKGKALDLAGGAWDAEGLFYVLSSKRLGEAITAAREFLGHQHDRAWWTAKKCRVEGCTGDLGMIVSDEQTIGVCSIDESHASVLPKG